MDTLEVSKIREKVRLHYRKLHEEKREECLRVVFSSIIMVHCLNAIAEAGSLIIGSVFFLYLLDAAVASREAVTCA